MTQEGSTLSEFAGAGVDHFEKLLDGHSSSGSGRDGDCCQGSIDGEPFRLVIVVSGASDERRLFSLGNGSSKGINQEVGQFKIVIRQLVFTNYDGKPIDPSTLTYNFGRIVKLAGLNARFHDLMHSYASLMLAAGIHPKIVSEALGHSTVSITLHIYNHVTPGLQEAAAKRLASVMPVGIVAKRHGSVTGRNDGKV